MLHPRIRRGGVGLALVLLCLAPPALAQVEDQLSAYTGENATGYLQPLADAFGAALNDGFFRSAYIPTDGLHFSVELRAMGVSFGDDDDTFTDLPERAEEYLEEVLGAWPSPLRSLTEERAYAPAHTSRWGPPYCIDAMLEHAAMHPIRHAHQLRQLMAT